MTQFVCSAPAAAVPVPRPCPCVAACHAHHPWPSLHTTAGVLAASPQELKAISWRVSSQPVNVIAVRRAIEIGDLDLLTLLILLDQRFDCAPLLAPRIVA